MESKRACLTWLSGWLASSKGPFFHWAKAYDVSRNTDLCLMEKSHCFAAWILLSQPPTLCKPTAVYLICLTQTLMPANHHRWTYCCLPVLPYMDSQASQPSPMSLLLIIYVTLCRLLSKPSQRSLSMVIHVGLCRLQPASHLKQSHHC